jgi:hypothetical protein
MAHGRCVCPPPVLGWWCRWSAMGGDGVLRPVGGCLIRAGRGGGTRGRAFSPPPLSPLPSPGCHPHPPTLHAPSRPIPWHPMVPPIPQRGPPRQRAVGAGGSAAGGRGAAAGCLPCGVRSRPGSVAPRRALGWPMVPRLPPLPVLSCPSPCPGPPSPCGVPCHPLSHGCTRVGGSGSQPRSTRHTHDPPPTPGTRGRAFLGSTWQIGVSSWCGSAPAPPVWGVGPPSPGQPSPVPSAAS